MTSFKKMIEEITKVICSMQKLMKSKFCSVPKSNFPGPPAQGSFNGCLGLCLGYKGRVKELKQRPDIVLNAHIHYGPLQKTFAIPLSEENRVPEQCLQSAGWAGPRSLIASQVTTPLPPSLGSGSTGLLPQLPPNLSRLLPTSGPEHRPSPPPGLPSIAWQLLFMTQVPQQISPLPRGPS